MVGERVYDHMHELHERGLVVAREHGQSKMVTTSDRFPECFGIPETEPERIRTFLAEKLGIKVGPKVVEPEVAKALAEAPPSAPGAAQATAEGADATPGDDVEAPPTPTAQPQVAAVHAEEPAQPAT